MKSKEEKTVKRRKTKLISVPKKKKVNKQKEIKEVKTKQEPKKKYISKKRLRRRRKFMLITSLVLIIAITLTVLSCTVFFPIKQIKVIGNKKYDTKEIVASLGVIKGDNLLLASENRANKVLKQEFNYIESVEFNKKFPFTLEVKVNEYNTYAQLKINNQYIRFGYDGKILDKTEKYIKGSPVIVGTNLNDFKIGDIIDLEDEKGKLKKVVEIIKAFEKNSINGVTLMNVKDMQDIRVTYKDRIVMLLGSDSNLDKKLIHAKATLEAKGNVTETGTLNLSRIPSAKNEASFIPRELEPEEIAVKRKK